MGQQSIFPALRYRDARAAIDWLSRAFGLEPHQVHDDPDGTVAHAELRLGPSIIMLATARGGDAGYDRVAPSPGTGALYAVVDDVDAHHERANAAGAEIVLSPYDTDYGSREYTARDPEGNVWSFGTYDPWAVTADG